MANEITGVKGVVTIDVEVLSYQDSISGPSVVIAHVTRWTMNKRPDIIPVDTFDSTSVFKKKMYGMVDVAGSLEGFMDDASVFKMAPFSTPNFQPSATAIIKLETKATIGYSFVGLISNLRIDVPKNGPALYTADYESSDDVGSLPPLA